MIQLTQKGKEIYLKNNKADRFTVEITVKVNTYVFGRDNAHRFLLRGYEIASNPLELKSLLDMGLIEIK